MQKINKAEEGQLSTKAFHKHLELLKEKHKSDLPITYLLSNPKNVNNSTGNMRTRVIEAKKYQSQHLEAFPFFKSISTVLNYEHDENE